jgi:hypothetical protein
MILGLITLTIAIAISAVSAYYSILGLVAIFAAAAMPVIIMGSALEAGKIMTTLWLHKNWNKASLAYKLYLVPAVMFLMVLTSLSVYGFLSKAHLDQAVPTGDISAKIELIDTKIATQRENINAARKVLSQMDGAVDEVLSRSKTEQGAKNANTLRQQQAKDREKLTTDIGQAQKEIAALNEQRSVVSQDLRKVEAEVGPIKYVAALIYGDNSSADMLERAVRWIIILIVAVFDPLALVLILAATRQFQWSAEERRKAKSMIIKDDIITVADIDSRDKKDDNYLEHQTMLAENSSLKEHLAAKCVTEAEQGVKYDNLFAENQRLQHELSLIEKSLQEETQKLADVNTELSIISTQQEINYDTVIADAKRQYQDNTTQLTSEIESMTVLLREITENYTKLQAEYDHLVTDQQLQQNILANSIQRNQDAEKKIASLETELETVLSSKSEDNVQVLSLTQENNELHTTIDQLTTELTKLTQSIEQQSSDPTIPEFTATAWNEVISEEKHPPSPLPQADYGTEFPATPTRGDLFLRTDFKPFRLFKWNDQTWMNINKNSTDAYAYNDSYIQYLISLLQSRELEWDELSATEQQQTEIMLGGNIGSIR